MFLIFIILIYRFNKTFSLRFIFDLIPLIKKIEISSSLFIIFVKTKARENEVNSNKQKNFLLIFVFLFYYIIVLI